MVIRWARTLGLLDRANANHLGSIDDRLTTLTCPNSIAPMDTEQTCRRIPVFQFRVLIIGRANAGKTSILQRVCETTKSPTIYRGKKKVCVQASICEYGLTADQVTLNPSIDVSNNGTSLRLLLNMDPARRAHDRRRACLLQS